MFSQASYGGQVTHTESPREKLLAFVDNMSVQREDAFQASDVDSFPYMPPNHPVAPVNLAFKCLILSHS